MRNFFVYYDLFNISKRRYKNLIILTLKKTKINNYLSKNLVLLKFLVVTNFVFFCLNQLGVYDLEKS